MKMSIVSVLRYSTVHPWSVMALRFPVPHTDKRSDIVLLNNSFGVGGYIVIF